MKIVEVLIDNSLEKTFCDSANFNLKKGDYVIISVDNILCSGQVIANNLDMATKNKVIRKVTSKDLQTISKNSEDSIKCLQEAKKLQDKLNLSMSFVEAYYTFDRRQLYFLFIADNRIDFRELAKKLADKYRTRIELRQIGIRDKAKRIGGLGPCGLFLCCNSFLTDFNSVSINMAKNQFLALNPSKINGVCGRLLCCLNYENSVYSELKVGAPKLGSLYETEKGKGKVVSVDIFKGNCSVELKDKSIITVTYQKEDDCIK